MAQYTILIETIWPAIYSALDHIQQERKEAPSKEVRAGLNFTLLISAACCLEGILEAALKAFVCMRHDIYNKLEIEEFQIRRSMNCWFNRLQADTARRINLATGTAGYNEMFALLIGKQLSELNHITPFWEGIGVLFHLRNVLGHGREVTATQLTSANPIEEDFRGGYRHAEDYLRKMKLIDRKFTDRHTEFIFLSDGVADHFVDLVRHVPAAISESLNSKDTVLEKEWFDKAVIKEMKNVF